MQPLSLELILKDLLTKQFPSLNYIFDYSIKSL